MITKEQLEEKLREMGGYEHLLIGFAKQAVNGICAADPKSVKTSQDIAREAFNIAQACVDELIKRAEDRGDDAPAPAEKSTLGYRFIDTQRVETLSKTFPKEDN